MKFLLFIAFVALVAIVTAVERPVVEKCKAETGVSEETFEAMHYNEITDDPKRWCFMKCMCLNLEVCDGDLKLVAENLNKSGTLSIDKLKAGATKCNKLTGENDCETVNKKFKCLFEEVPEILRKGRKEHKNKTT